MDLLIPVVTLLDPDGRPDLPATGDYARALRDWSGWATALLCGTTGQGDALGARARAAVFDTWAEVLPADRILCCAWNPAEAAGQLDRGRRVLLAVAEPAGAATLAAVLAGLPGTVALYSHPRFGWRVTPDLLTELYRRGAAPAGVKLSKCPPATLAACRRSARTGLALWDGSARHPAESVAAGATGIVAGCLAGLPGSAPAGPEELHQLAEPVLRVLDALPDRAARRRWVVDQVRRLLAERGSRCSG